MSIVRPVVVAVLLLAFPENKIPVAIASWVLLAAFVAGIPYFQRRRLATLRARARATALPVHAAKAG